jgi:hypothetical protein
LIFCCFLNNKWGEKAEKRASVVDEKGGGTVNFFLLRMMRFEPVSIAAFRNDHKTDGQLKLKF